MATLLEINSLAADGGGLADKIKGAMLVAAQAVIFEGDQVEGHTNRMKWAKKVFTDLGGNSDDMQKAVVAHANAIDPTITVAGFSALSDTTLKDYVAALIPVFADGN